MTTCTSATEILSAYVYDWNQDGSAALRGSVFVGVGDSGLPVSVGDRVVLYGAGMAVVTRVTAILGTTGGSIIHTEYAHQASLTIRSIPA